MGAEGGGMQAMLLAQRGYLREADRLLDRLDAERPGSCREVRWTIAAWWDDPAAAVSKISDLADDDGPCFHAYLQELPERRARKAKGLPSSCERMPIDWRIRLLAREGDVDGAYEAMNAPRPNTRRALAFLFYPEMKAFRQDPRFMPLVRQFGLTDYWLASGRWPDFCRDPDLPYDCRLKARGAD